MELVKLIHISCVLASGLFFLGRGLVMLKSPQFVTRVWVRRSAEGIDTVLLVSGVSLIWITGQMPWKEPWLASKLGLLLLYILLGMMAFHWGRSQVARLAAWLMALTVFAMMALVAMARTPWPF